MEGYYSEHFNSLPTFTQAQRNLEAHQDKLEAVGAVLHAHGLSHEIGIALLHRHFDLAPDEILVEKVYPLRTQSVGRPRPQDGHGKVLPHLFRAVINDNDGACVWFPVEFCDAENDDGTLAERYTRFAENGPLLNEIAQVLKAEGAINALGLSLFHGREEIPCASDEVLTESTDEVRRTLVMRPAKQTAIGVNSTPTLWRFDGRKPLMACTCQRDGNGDHAHYESN